jgi:hypothetical protein
MPHDKQCPGTRAGASRSPLFPSIKTWILYETIHSKNKGIQEIGSPSRIRTKVVELLRQLSSDALDEMLRGKNTLARDLLSMLSEVRL